VGNPHVLLLQGRPTAPEPPQPHSEVAQRFADWLEDDAAPAPALTDIRAEAQALARYMASLATDVQAFAQQLHTGAQRSLQGSDLPTVAHAEYAAGFRAGAYAVATDAAKHLSAALERAQKAAQSC
jgi:hypothetical protein